jgi:hypothetical protein
MFWTGSISAAAAAGMRGAGVGHALGVTMMMTWLKALLGEGRRPLEGGSARRGVMVVVVAGAAVVCAGLLTGARSAPPVAGARAAAPGVQWGTAEEVPGLAALNKGGNAKVTSVSCWAVNNCAAGGYYTDRRRHSQAFVVVEQKGRWGDAEQPPGTAALNKGGNAQVVSVSCAPDGYCAAGGYYTDRRGHSQAFVVTRPEHRWRTAVEVPGSAALNTSGGAQVTSVSCPAARNCAAGGFYTGSTGGLGFVVSQAKGVWGTAQQVPALAALNTSGNARVASLSCWSAGNCAAGGSYDGQAQAFVVSEVNRVWGAAEGVPGLAALNTANLAEVTSVSCARDGYCAAGGTYEQSTPAYQYVTPFVVNATNGVWGTVVVWSSYYEFGAPVFIDAVSCPSAGSCVAAGYQIAGIPESIWVSQTNGVWAPGGLAQLPGYYAQNGFLYSLSCPSAGNCGAGGVTDYNGTGGKPAQAWVSAERNGAWASARRMPGTVALNKGKYAAVDSVSCPSAGHCTAAGFYTDAKKHTQAFVSGP